MCVATAPKIVNTTRRAVNNSFYTILVMIINWNISLCVVIVLVIVNTARTTISNLLYIVSELVIVSAALLCAL